MQIVGRPKAYENNAPGWVIEAYAYDSTFIYETVATGFMRKSTQLLIQTRTDKGVTIGVLGDYLVKDEEGNIYIEPKYLFRDNFIRVIE